MKRGYRQQASSNQRTGIKRYQRIARKKGGSCPEQEYRNNKTNLFFICKVGHEFQATPHDIDRGNWCPKCAGRGKTIEDMRELAAERPVSEFMSQKLDLITLHGMVKEEGVTEGARRATGVSPSPAEMKGEYHECDQKDKSIKPILL